MGNTQRKMENYEEENYGEENKKAKEQSWAKKYWWVFLIIAILNVSAYGYFLFNKKDGNAEMVRINSTGLPRR